VIGGLDADAARVRQLLAPQLKSLYHLPFGKFERLTPAGPPAQVAEALAPYRAGGAGHITLIPAARSPEAGVEHVASGWPRCDLSRTRCLGLEYSDSRLSSTAVVIRSRRHQARAGP